MRSRLRRGFRVSGGLGAMVVAFVLALGFGDIGTPGNPVPSHRQAQATTPSTQASDSTTGGGALPVVPVGGGGCIIGLNCGCVHNCPNQHRHPAPATVQPPDTPPAPPRGG